MLFGSIVRATQDQPALERLAGKAQPPIKSWLGASRALKNALHGVWVGHPLHPVLTDFPVGAWTMAGIFDLLHALDERPESAYAADRCVAIGIAAAAAAAVTGIADWSDTFGRPARLGIVHAACNTSALALYAGSLALRKRKRPLATLLSFAGYGMVTIGAALGGHLVYAETQGVNHARADELPTEWIRLLPLAELMDGKPHRAKLRTRDIVVVRQDETIFALLDSCAHLGGPLSKGTVDDCSITCPWHGSRFALEDGRVLEGPATVAQPIFETRVNAGYVEVRAFAKEAP